MFQAKKQPLYLLDRSILLAKLDTLYTLYGLEGVIEILNDWLTSQPDLKAYWRVEKVADYKELEAYDEVK